jgi:hypothetical protein
MTGPKGIGRIIRGSWTPAKAPHPKKHLRERERVSFPELGDEM